MDEALIGFSSGADALYEDSKVLVDPESWTPMQVFREAFPETVVVQPAELTVIRPFTRW